MMVFSATWFSEHQTQLLRFANSRLGRRTLRINGKRSAVGRRRITRIEPHAITWENQDGTMSTEFCTGPVYARRLYTAFKPLWFTIHGWDIGVANRVVPQLNLGFDTLTTYAQAGSGGNSIDGDVSRYLPYDEETLSTIRNGAGVNVYNDSFLIPSLFSAATPNQFYELGRCILTFDTSSIPAGATVTAATLSLYLTDYFSDFGSMPVHVTSANPNQSNQISAADYQRVGSTSFSSATGPGMTLDTYHNFVLNAAGRSNIARAGISGLGLRLEADLNNSFTGTWVPDGRTEYGFASSDAGGGTGPKLVVTYTNTLSTAASGALKLGIGVVTKTTHRLSISGTLSLAVNLNITKDVEPIAGKEYVYRVYNQAGTYLGVWKDVIDEPEFTQRLNTPGTTMTVRMARSANTTTEKRDTLMTISGEVLTAQDGQELVANYVTNNTVGEDTDVDLNYFVDIYVHYGGFETLETRDGQVLTTQGGEDLLFPVGAPLGRRIFSGWIMDYAAAYGEEAGVEVTLASNGSELANQVINSAGVTTVTYASTDHGQAIRNLLAMNSGKMGQGLTTVSNTGVSISPTFRLNTILEGIEDVYNQSPDGWYWYGNVAENEVYFRQKSSTPHHTFVLGKHIGSLKLSKSIENLKSELYFVGGNPGSGILYKKYTTTSAYTRKGIDRQTDRRVTLLPTAQKRADKTFARWGGAVYTTTVVIPSGAYDIDSIELGQVVAFANGGNFIDDLQLQIVGLHYAAYRVELELGELLPRQVDIVDDTIDSQQQEQYETIPSTPS